MGLLPIAVVICVLGVVYGKDTTVTCNCNYPGGTTASPGATCPGTTASPTDCVTPGGWSDWTAWTSCTASCNGGLQMRERTCDQPKPGSGCSLCAGDGVGVRVCNPQQCPPQPTVAHTHTEEFVAFSVGSRTPFNPGSEARIPMEVVFYNPDGHFKTDNAFYAPVKGVYSFSFSGTTLAAKEIWLRLYTQKPGASKVLVATAFEHATHYGSASTSVLVIMDVGETASVWLPGGSGFGLYGGTTIGPTTTFSGELKKKIV